MVVTCQRTETRIAYILLVHKYPDLAKRLVARLAPSQTTFFVHGDRAAPLDDFTATFKHAKGQPAQLAFCFAVPPASPFSARAAALCGFALVVSFAAARQVCR